MIVLAYEDLGLSDERGMLAFTATTSTGEVLEFELPLHPQTSSAVHVGTLLEGVLDKLSEIVEGPSDMSDGDVIQALTLAVAVRLSVAGLPAETARQLVEELANLAVQGFEGGRRAMGPGVRH